MRKILAAPDSFKESMSAQEACEAIASGVWRVWPGAEVVFCPMADGGEGTLDAVVAGGDFTTRTLTVADAYGRPRLASYGWDETRKVALVEAAEACGLEHVAPDDRDVWEASSYGVGELIAQALKDGATQIYLTLGGSATNDAGAGMLSALGVRFSDAAGNQLQATPAALAQVAEVDASGLLPQAQSASFRIAVDVNNPLLGSNGATYVFGPQKGAAPRDLPKLDEVLRRVATCANQDGERQDQRDTPGAGAAGGLGWAALQFLGAKAQPGVELVAELTNLEGLMDGAQLVFTGEGKADSQTLSGKTAFGVAQVASRQGIPVILLAGSVFDGAAPLLESGVSALFPILRQPGTLADALAAGPENVTAAAETACRLIQVGENLQQ